ncbi:BN860_11518g1_1 [Zygosaccharomyces bailii CLIB 213]|uniref:BN860_11518g1_1 n=1 Tax=Zygosaccharomyces bailii (strain CLIB 213 / ATCC 58445 / CBS 680 / BCRC 21525 / NBRC 1098 / NCYC 1416 / NRRL Y-2227) TaxID=1333698 RepID=A0A8J2T468_ZYGB2|nr:BN860_11518g1_1 [Zygosaccharomyces bailii CLIB 213]
MLSNLLKLGNPRVANKYVAYNQSIRCISILGNLKSSEGSTKGFKRLGRGPSSSKGKTSGRGQKGQKARGKVKSWFEGGQTPIYKLFPKIGFTNVNSRPLNELNLARVQWFHDLGRLNLEPGEVLDMKKMKDLGLVTGPIKHGIKILGNGKTRFNVPIKIEASKATPDAITAIESAGGEFTARYFSRLGLRAHLVPHWFLEKRGRIPLQARPIKRKDIQYYSDDSRRGYLVKEQNEYWQLIRDARQGGAGQLTRKRTKKSALEVQLEKLSQNPDSNKSVPVSSKIVTFDDFKSQN